MAHKLRRGVPVAKIIHQKWFYGLKFYTNKNTLDPRPDTETLVAAVIADCDVNAGPNILDLGTGTGCIIAALIKNISGATGVAIDKSFSATRIARKNMRNLNISDRVRVYRRSFDDPHAAENGKFDIIVSNPPYIAQNDPRVDDGAMHDPKISLYADENGLAAYKKIARNAHNWITPGGKIYLEIGAGQESDVRNIFTCAGWKFNRAEKDLGGMTRVLVFTSK